MSLRFTLVMNGTVCYVKLKSFRFNVFIKTAFDIHQCAYILNIGIGHILSSTAYKMKETNV